MGITEVTDSSFNEEVLESGSLVVVDFYAPWCGPCHMLAPILEELAEEFECNVKFVKLNVDENPSISGRYGIRSIPTVVFFKDGKELASLIGVHPNEEYKKKIEALLGNRIN